MEACDTKVGAQPGRGKDQKISTMANVQQASYKFHVSWGVDHYWTSNWGLSFMPPTIAHTNPYSFSNGLCFLSPWKWNKTLEIFSPSKYKFYRRDLLDKKLGQASKVKTKWTLATHGWAYITTHMSTAELTGLYENLSRLQGTTRQIRAA